MNYESIVKKPNPFSGLSVQSRQRLVVYLCYVATPTMTPDMVRQRWGDVLSADDWPLAHEAIDLIDEIKKELVKRKSRRSIMCMMLCTALILMCAGTPVFIVLISRQTEEAHRREEVWRKREVERKRKESEEAVQKEREADEARRKEQEEARRIEEKRKREEAEEAARKRREEDEIRRRAQEKTRMLKASAEMAKRDMQIQCNNAKSAGAKEHAITEWNGAVDKWNSGDDKFKNGDYNGASALYHQAESLFGEAERISRGRKVAEFVVELQELQKEAAALVDSSDKWWKWSVDETALLAMGDKINKTVIVCKEEARLWILNDFTDELNRVAEIDNPEQLKETAIKLISASDDEFSNCVKLLPCKDQNLLMNKRCQYYSFDGIENKLKNLMLRCYELSSDNGNAESSYRLYLIYGGAQNVIQSDELMIRHDDKLAMKYLKRAVDKGHPLAKKIYERIRLKSTDCNKPNRRADDKPSRPTRNPAHNICSECGGTGYARYVSWSPTFLSRSAYHKEVRHMKCKKCRGSGRASF
jgi:chemotaxis protein histidine kinase CheA